MRALLVLAVESGHSGVAHPLTGYEVSDVALFVFAAIAVWQVRRALRKRFAKARGLDGAVVRKRSLNETPPNEVPPNKD
ncbi:hypothetical protein [Sphingomonas faeni]|uniref:hypothetical protein n=1 Tax=Sphingomonas faeni TaxID=185950 RepID=UPI003351A573